MKSAHKGPRFLLERAIDFANLAGSGNVEGGGYKGITKWRLRRSEPFVFDSFPKNKDRLRTVAFGGGMTDHAVPCCAELTSEKMRKEYSSQVASSPVWPVVATASLPP